MGWNPVQKELFVNPYNFVPLGKKPTRLKDGEVTAEKKHTGWLDCKLITKTPLIIPDTEKMTMDEHYSGHKKYEFLQLKVNDGFVPAVPGSQIRGVVRNIYETITDSCMGTSKNTVLSHRALEFANPGVLKYENEKWVLYKAERYRICTAKTHLWNKKTKDWVEPLYSMNDEGRIKVGEKYFENCSQVSFKYHTLTRNDLELNYVDKIYCNENETNNETNVESGFLLMIPEAKTGKIYDSIMKP
ncbi:MAG: RAMP superfamily CRISPR-associated protein, partial [Anaerovorax sp.]